jgi:major membrane immunogen (membrane-anchored lipoprotein)
MKRLILFFVTVSLSLLSYSQSEVGKLTFDNGYYEGVCLNNTDNKYITHLYLQFLTNGGDTTLAIVPYRLKNSNNKKTYVKNITVMNDTIVNYLTELSGVVGDKENYEIVGRPWSIDGFDNFTYFEVEGNKLSFSINIADIVTNSIEVFYFDGVISDTGNDIDAIIYSDNGTFPKCQVTLQLTSKILSQK